MAGGITGGVLAARAGPRAIVRNTIGGAVILALIEGVMLLVTKSMMKFQMAQMGANVKVDTLEPPVPPGFGTRSTLEGGLQMR